jgi:hypothetical protein
LLKILHNQRFKQHVFYRKAVYNVEETFRKNYYLNYIITILGKFVALAVDSYHDDRIGRSITHWGIVYSWYIW